MAQLILSEEEKKIPFSQWDDETLGKLVKTLGLIFHEKKEDSGKIELNKMIPITSAGVLLVSAAAEANSEETTVSLKGAYKGEQHFGDWEIVIRKT
jgi:hypothetical protein